MFYKRIVTKLILSLFFSLWARHMHKYKGNGERKTHTHANMRLCSKHCIQLDVTQHMREYFLFLRRPHIHSLQSHNFRFKTSSLYRQFSFYFCRCRRRRCRLQVSKICAIVIDAATAAAICCYFKLDSIAVVAIVDVSVVLVFVMIITIFVMTISHQYVVIIKSALVSAYWVFALSFFSISLFLSALHSIHFLIFPRAHRERLVPTR